MTPIEFHAALRAYCFRTHASITSSLRTEKHNQAVRGHIRSAHLLDLAADVVYDLPVLLEVRQETATRLGLALVVEDDHDHLQAPRPGP